jgi:hypothetical protein
MLKASSCCATIERRTIRLWVGNRFLLFAMDLATQASTCLSNHPEIEIPIDICASLSLGWRILLPGCCHAMEDGQADQTNNAHHDPPLWYLEQVRAHGQADNQYDVPHEVNAE